VYAQRSIAALTNSALSAAVRPEKSSTLKVAVVGSTIGSLAALVVLGEMLIGSVDRRPAAVDVLVAPIVVVLHRVPYVARIWIDRAPGNALR
jgi:hypothetical protein